MGNGPDRPNPDLRGYSMAKNKRGPVIGRGVVMENGNSDLPGTTGGAQRENSATGAITRVVKRPDPPLEPSDPPRGPDPEDMDDEVLRALSQYRPQGMARHETEPIPPPHPRVVIIVREVVRVAGPWVITGLSIHEVAEHGPNWIRVLKECAEFIWKVSV
jgi:hypothetical protein